MGFEVELKFRLNKRQTHAEIAARVESLGGLRKKHIDQEDTYLAHPGRDFTKTGESLRIRRENAHCVVTYKGPRRRGPVKIRREIELPIGIEGHDPGEFIDLFRTLGFRPRATIRKRRVAYGLSWGGRIFAIGLDDAGDVGRFVEVETIAADEADIPPARHALERLARTLGLRHVEPRSYLRMNLEREGRR
jgi:adenylate cyclase class 2